MTETLGSATSAARDGAREKGNPLADVAHSEAADRLKAELQDYLAAQATRLLTGVGRKLGETTNKLNDMAEGNSPGLARLALDGGRKIAEGKGPLRTAVELGASRAKDNVVGALKGLGGGKGKRKRSAGKKPTVIIEHIDVGVPLRTAYDQWTQYQDFSTFAKGVKSAGKADDTTSDWQLKVRSPGRQAPQLEGGPPASPTDRIAGGPPREPRTRPSATRPAGLGRQPDPVAGSPGRPEGLTEEPEERVGPSELLEAEAELRTDTAATRGLPDRAAGAPDESGTAPTPVPRGPLAVAAHEESQQPQDQNGQGDPPSTYRESGTEKDQGQEQNEQNGNHNVNLLTS
ncbi:hypothetical protein SGRIM128S_08799 [Streptomyces griseomycini]